MPEYQYASMEPNVSGEKLQPSPYPNQIGLRSSDAFLQISRKVPCKRPELVASPTRSISFPYLRTTSCRHTVNSFSYPKPRQKII